MRMPPLSSPAKINLHLAVGKKRPDGFHDIESLFCRVSLRDEIVVSLEDAEKSEIVVEGLEGMCERGKDTMTKAAELWMRRTGRILALHVNCRKRIPPRSGLGGGSSNAATLLKALEAYVPIGPDALMDVAARVGSDVPFFVSGERAAWVTGRGEVVEPVRTLPPLWGVIVMPASQETRTEEAYRRLDRVFRPAPEGREKILSALGRGSRTFRSCMRNDFRLVVKDGAFYEKLERIAGDLDGYGALSGSGAAWFFASEKSSQVSLFQRHLCDEMGDGQQHWLVTFQ